MEHLVLTIALIGVLGIGAQWLAWRLNLPAIVLMAVAGLLFGPILGVLDPGADFGELLQPMISIAVAIILFEGGLTLNFKEISGLSKAVRRLATVGVPVGWLLGTLAAHYLAGLSWPVAALFAGIMVVTGPTVIIPLLRQARLAPRPAAILKWEGIVNDPIGALLAVFVYEALVFSEQGESLVGGGIRFLAAAGFATVLGIVLGIGIARAFHRGFVPEFLKAPVILCTVLTCFSLSNWIEHETGLLAVTVMGMALANSRLASIQEMRRFKENITVLLVSGVFVILTATLDPAILNDVGPGVLLFLVAMLFIVRPLTVWTATIGTGLTWQERTLIGWIAPRGIVAAAVSGLFAAKLVEIGYPEGALLVPLAFGMIFLTIVAHGFSVEWLAKRLGLASTERPGVLIVGASPWSSELALSLKKLEVPVTLADTDWRRLKTARLAEVKTYYGEILSEVSEHRLDFNRFGYLLAVTGNEAYNALICTDLGPEMGRTTSFQLAQQYTEEDSPRSFAHTLKGRTLFQTALSYDELIRRHYTGWSFQKTTLSEQYTFEDYQAGLPEKAELVLIQKKNGKLAFASPQAELKAEEGDTLISYCPPGTKSERAEKANGGKGTGAQNNGRKSKND